MTSSPPLPFIFTSDDSGSGDVALFHELLDFLASESVPCTFFTVPCAAGLSLAERPEWVNALQRAQAEGHDVQLHGFAHSAFEFGQPPDFMLDLMAFASGGQRGWAVLERDRTQLELEWQRASLRERLRTGQQILHDTLNVEPVAFRAPCLATCPALYDALADVGIRCDSSRAINSTGWEYCRKDFSRHGTWDERYSPRAYSITDSVIEMPIMSEYTWFITQADMEVHLRLACEDFDRATTIEDAAFVPLSHFYAMTGNHRTGLELYRRLFAYARAKANVRFLTLADYFRQHPTVS